MCRGEGLGQSVDGFADRGGGAVRFFADESERDRYRWSLKERPCPACLAVGFLICHGHLWGYVGDGPLRKIRGYRFFCNNRGRRGGCGRTYSIHLARVLPRRQTPAPLLSRFFSLMLSCLSRRRAWFDLGTGVRLSTFYRLWEALCRSAMEIRRRLTQLVAPPAPDLYTDDLHWTIAHLERAFDGQDCPVSAYQRHFQRPLLV